MKTTIAISKKKQSLKNGDSGRNLGCMKSMKSMVLEKKVPMSFLTDTEETLLDNEHHS